MSSRVNRLRRNVKKVQSQQQPVVHEEKVIEKKMDEDSTSSECVQENQQDKMKRILASNDDQMIRLDEDMYEAIRSRYQELLKELWENQNTLDEFEFTKEEKDILNKRVKLWLEYFVSTATFRNGNINLFEYMDSFTDTQKFV